MIETLDNIDRLPSPTQKSDVERYVCAGRPFICTDLLHDSLLARFCDRDAVIDVFADSLIRDPNGGRVEMTVRDYFARAEVPPGSLNVSFPPKLHDELIALAQRSPIGADAMFLTAWMGRQRCLQRLHCDMDGRHNFLVQAFGDKRISLVPPAQTQKLMPALDKRLLFSEVPLHRYDAAEKLRFLRFVDGRDALLRPGEALYIPPLWWHAVEYLSDSFSVSWRPEPTPLFAELSTAWRHLWTSEWPLWQGIVSALASDPDAAAAFGERARAVHRLLVDGAGREARLRLRELHDTLCPGRYALPFGNADLPTFEPRDERPLPPKRDAWRADDVPRLQPYLRFAVTSAGGASAILVVDDKRVVAEVALDDGDADSMQALANALQRPDAHATVAELAGELGCEVEDLAAILEQLAAEGWVATALRRDGAAPARASRSDERA